MNKKITKPTLLIRKDICLRNICKMSEKAAKNGLMFRPHFKTHQSAEVGNWFKGFGVDRITVSSVSMARYFADHGWQDILIAFPLNVLEIEEINELAEQLSLSVLIESTNTLDILEENLKHNCNFYIKIDTGYHRTGMDSHNYAGIRELLDKSMHNPRLKFSGFLIHAGNTYEAKNVEEIKAIHDDSLYKLSKLKKEFSENYPDLILSIGDTPSCSLMNDFEGIDEIRPGNFVFYDLMQYRLGACKLEDIAVAIVCPVVARHPERQEIIIYGGAVHLSKDSLQQPDGSLDFGAIAMFDDQGWEQVSEDSYLRKLSQEHGVIRCSRDQFELIGIGDLLAVIPVHSCLSMNLMRSNYNIIE
ncbi:MAG: alanine racemase [Bacteroidota bacterium]|nr:alanine racemase [Bacteroidota bacterium]